MGYAIKILNCNQGCTSCYVSKLQDKFKDYDIKAIHKTLLKCLDENPSWNPPNIHGGEPLLIKIKDLELLFSTVFSHIRNDKPIERTSIQTNLLNLKPRHIELFKKYNTNVGISLDADSAGRGYNPEPVLKNMDKLKIAEIEMSIISLIRKSCCDPDFTWEFIKRMNEKYGIIHFKTNTIIDFFGNDQEPDIIDLSNFYIKMVDYVLGQKEVIVHPFNSTVDLLLGGDGQCGSTHCDPLHTIAEVPIFNDGSLGNCLKNYGTQGHLITRANKHYPVREILFKIPQWSGGCLDCIYWHICRGGCPGASIDNDWRNKTRFCEALKVLFKTIYDKIKGMIPNAVMVPDIYPGRLKVKNSLQYIKGSTYSRNSKINLKELEADNSVNDSGNHGDSYTDQHGDAPHGDHTDHAGKK